MNNITKKSQGRFKTKGNNMVNTSKDESTQNSNLKIITLQLGSTCSRFMPDGSWHPTVRDSKKQTLMELKLKNEKLSQEHEKLSLKHEVLLELADNTTTEYMAVEQELKQLRKIFKKLYGARDQGKTQREK